MMVQYAVDRRRESVMTVVEVMLQLLQVMELSGLLQIVVCWLPLSSRVLR